jgi:hypothetical protein
MSQNGKRRKSGEVKLRPADVRRIRKRYRPRDPEHGQAPIARDYGVTKMAISLLLSGKTWSSIR